MGAGLMHVHAPSRGWPRACRVDVPVHARQPAGDARTQPAPSRRGHAGDEGEHDEHLARYLADVADPAGPDDERAMADAGAGPQPGRPDGRSHAIPSAVVWVNGRGAVVARVDEAGEIATCTIERGSQDQALFLNRVVRSIGDPERVMILGPESARLALEREYVDMNRRPDRLVDLAPTGLLEEPELVDRLRRLAA